MRNRLLGIVLGVLLIFGCNGGGGSSTKKVNPCDGPVPCLSVGWGEVASNGSWDGEFAKFSDADGDAVLLISDGEVMAITTLAVIDGEIVLVGLEGEVTSCYDAEFYLGAVDEDFDGVIDYFFESTEGQFNICNETLRVSNVVINGEKQIGFIATFDNMITIDTDKSISSHSAMSVEDVDQTKLRVELLKDFLE